MGLLFGALYYVLFTFFLLMWGRFIVDMVRVISPNWRPRGIVLVVIEFGYTVTDPPIRAVRRVIPPLRLGPVAFDLAWTVVLLGVIILMSVVSGLARAL
ncbi:MAG TPA: YggT family protein [Microbacteriaceae bacterium]|nr:YggT family protein [Microbacteriaceae bacterium]